MKLAGSVHAGAAACLVLFFCGGCGTVQLCRPPECVSGPAVADVVITEVTSNDLAQELVFAESRGGEKFLFIRDFYKEGSSPKAGADDVMQSVRQTRRLKGQAVSVQYCVNTAGNKIILSIKNKK